ncbi:MAG TPA: glycogen debranching enzyme, partial [Mycobacterium sp.]
DNNDGESHNRSWNCGVEGPTDDAEINALRSRQQRNFLATLLLSQGVPMIAHGDELGRTQDGNNNVYCQDNELSWIDWASADTELMEFARTVSEVRTAHPVFRRRRFFSGEPLDEGGLPDIVWLNPDGTPMTGEDWGSGFAKSIAVFLNGDAIPYMDVRGERVTDASFLLFFNAHHEPIEFTLPPAEYAQSWTPVIDTASAPDEDLKPAGAAVSVEGRAVLVLRASDD